MDRIINFFKQACTRQFAGLAMILACCQGINILLAAAMHDTLVSVIGASTVHFLIDELGIIAAVASSVAAWTVIVKRTAEEYNAPIAIWIVLSLLVFAWLTSLVMLSSTLFAMVFAAVLVLATIDTVVVFHHMNKYAAWLMYPFLIWALCIFGITTMIFF